MEKNLLQTGSEALRKAALNEEAKQFILGNEVVFNVLKKAAHRYIGGETLDEAILKVQTQNKDGYACSIEFIGENTQTEKEAREASHEFIRICQRIRQHNLKSAVSLDLSHIGLTVSKELCFHNLSQICMEASLSNLEIMISAEGVERTDAVIDTYKNISRHYPLIGITLQAYLHRTKDDFKEVIKEKGRIRMVKGAFETPPGHSIARGEKLDEVYIDYVNQLLAQKHRCSIATHHDKIQQEIKKRIQLHQSEAETYEFESLFGICNEQLAALKQEGYPVKVYFVYGREWYLYVCNRIAEYPMNLFQALKDIVGE